MREHYKSWSDLNRQLTTFLCDEYKSRITYFLTRYHKVHNSYGRAAIRLDGRELVCFSWIEMYRQESQVSKIYAEDNSLSYSQIEADLKHTWDENGTYCEADFLNAVLEFRSMSIQDALQSENYIIRILAILDRRVGKRTLAQIRENREYLTYPLWVRQFYLLRLYPSEPNTAPQEDEP